MFEERRRTLSRLVPLTDRMRLSTGDHTCEHWYKEWHHFCVMGEGVRAIANLNLCRDPRPGSEPNWVARVILLVHETEWVGDVETVPMRDVEARRGEIGLRLGQNSLQFADGCYHLSLSLASKPISLYLRLKPMTYPLLRSKAALGEGNIDWVVVPRLAASGQIAVDHRCHELHEAPAYHDHNWGHWLWGHDFSWQWGFVLPAFSRPAWTCVFNCVSDRARNEARELKLTLWKNETVLRLFMYEEIEVRQHGYLAPRHLPKFPAVMNLLAPERTNDVPHLLEIEAGNGRDRLHCSFEAEAAAQILVPNETDLGLTAINEVYGRLTLDGIVKGERVSAMGDGIFEFLT